MNLRNVFLKMEKQQKNIETTSLIKEKEVIDKVCLLGLLFIKKRS